MAMKNILFGASIVLEFFQTGRAVRRKMESLYPTGSSDMESLRDDWRNVGRDLWWAIDQEKTKPPETKAI